MAPGSKNEYPFSTLEDTIANFIRDFNILWDAIRSMNTPGYNESDKIMSPTKNPQPHLVHTDNYKEYTTNYTGNFALVSSNEYNRLHQQLQILEKCLNLLKIGDEKTQHSFFQIERIIIYKDSSYMEIARKYSQVYFDFHFITDQLVWYLTFVYLIFKVLMNYSKVRREEKCWQICF